MTDERFRVQDASECGDGLTGWWVVDDISDVTVSCCKTQQAAERMADILNQEHEKEPKT